jgi:dynein heavy chain 1
VIDPKAIDKESLYGTLDATTLEWTDGIFTATLRAILGNLRGEKGVSPIGGGREKKILAD